MHVGLSAYDIAAADLVELGRAADELGFDSIWLGEHIVLPLDYGARHPTTGTSAHGHHKGPIIDPSTVLVDPLVALSAVAAVTTRISLATGIYLLPLRHPLMSARMVATLHDVSNGRMVLGVGSGWLAEEFAAVGVDFDVRRGRFEEAIEIVRASFRGEPFEHHGDHFDFGPVQVCPRPIHVPLVLGGNTEPALRRAARLADGWFSSGTPSYDDAARLHERLMALRDEAGATNSFTMHFRTAGATPDEFDRYEAAGIERLVIWADQVWPKGAPLDEQRTAIAAAADRLGVVPPGPTRGSGRRSALES